MAFSWSGDGELNPDKLSQNGSTTPWMPAPLPGFPFAPLLLLVTFPSLLLAAHQIPALLSWRNLLPGEPSWRMVLPNTARNWKGLQQE